MVGAPMMCALLFSDARRSRRDFPEEFRHVSNAFFRRLRR